MKNELMARAMTHIDSELIEEAREFKRTRARVLTPNLIKALYRYGAVAACALLTVGILLGANLGKTGVLLYGESISETPRGITEYIPRALAYSVEPKTITEISIPLELEFKRSTTLTLDEGSMIVLDKNGTDEFVGTEYEARGCVSICLILPPDISEAKLSTNRNYNIVLTKDLDSEDWYVNIDKK